MKLIEINSRKYGKHYAIVDDEDFDRLNRFTWSLIVQRGYRKCAVSNAVSDVPGGRVLMHRYIVDAKSGEEVDHKDGNALNNQRNNLRKCTDAQNSRNMRKHIDGKCRFKGVYFDARRNKFYVRIFVNKKMLHIGYFIYEEIAALAYNEAAKEHFGEFARLNKL